MLWIVFVWKKFMPWDPDPNIAILGGMTWRDKTKEEMLGWVQSHWQRSRNPSSSMASSSEIWCLIPTYVPPTIQSAMMCYSREGSHQRLNCLDDGVVWSSKTISNKPLWKLCLHQAFHHNEIQFIYTTYWGKLRIIFLKNDTQANAEEYR